ncbi:MAG: hypothetical protein WCF65_06725 [Parachlamydiaceae bacterium]
MSSAIGRDCHLTDSSSRGLSLSDHPVELPNAVEYQKKFEEIGVRWLTHLKASAQYAPALLPKGWRLAKIDGGNDRIKQLILLDGVLTPRASILTTTVDFRDEMTVRFLHSS